ncbi:hypothetical protein P7H16_04620 [Paenibacillus larvae]|nr:hypothetical protein [Paenibacillus larvae]MDT2246412.1 hypothetical protein [Paenibacillus larvae]
MLKETIAAISTPLGEGGISVIRVSGDESIAIVNKIFKSRTPLTEAETHTVHYGHIVDTDGHKVEEVLVTVMRAPRSFTTEDVVEVSCHGGSYPLRKYWICFWIRVHVWPNLENLQKSILKRTDRFNAGRSRDRPDPGQIGPGFSDCAQTGRWYSVKTNPENSPGTG